MKEREPSRGVRSSKSAQTSGGVQSSERAQTDEAQDLKSRKWLIKAWKGKEKPFGKLNYIPLSHPCIAGSKLR